MPEVLEVMVPTGSLKDVISYLNQSLNQDEETLRELCSHKAPKLRFKYEFKSIEKINDDYLLFKYDRTIKGVSHDSKVIGVINTPDQ